MKEILQFKFGIVLFLFLTVVSIDKIRAQDEPSVEYEEMSLEEFHEMAFGRLDPNLYSSGILYDRTLKLSKFSQWNGDEQEELLSLGGWLKVYDELLEANTVHSSLELPLLDQDFYVELLQLHEYNPTEEDLVTVPLGILAFSYHEFKENAMEEGYIKVLDDRHYIEGEAPGGTPYDEKILFAASPLVGNFDAEKIRFTYDSKYFFTNLGEAPGEIQVRVIGNGDWRKLKEGQSFVMDVFPSDSLVLEFKVEIGDKVQRGKGKTGTNTLDQYASYENDYGNIKFDEIWDDVEAPRVIPLRVGLLGGSSTAKADVGVLYACSDKKIRKPFIISTGYDPAKLGGKTNKKGMDKKLRNYNRFGLMTYLHNHGFDIFIIRYRFGSDYVQNNSAIFQGLLERINAEKKANGSEIENIVMGWSLGALTASYTLSKMEKDFFDGGASSSHHSKLYISADGEHRGANIMLGAQHALHEDGPLGAFNIPLLGASIQNWPLRVAILLDMPTPQEILLYHYTQTGGEGNPGQAAHPNRTNYLNALSATQHQYTHNFGFPATTRNAGIAIGSIDATGYNFSPGTWMYKDLFTLAKRGYKWSTYKSIDTHELVYKKQELRCLGILPICYGTERRFKTNGNAKALDNAPGSTFYFHAGIGAALLLANKGSLLKIKKDCFVPSVSAIAMRGATTSNTNLNYSIENLFYIEPGTKHPFYGYPHLISNDPLTVTPFHAVAGNYENDFHDPKHLTEELKDFILSEVMANKLLLQNRTVGEFHGAYAADFEASLSIEAGSDITYMTQTGDFVIQNNAAVRMRAKREITLRPGFTAENGSSFQAKLGQFCSAGPSGGGTGFPKPTDDHHEIVINRDFDEMKHWTLNEKAFEIFPNPLSSSTKVKIKMPREGIGNILIKDLQGKIVKKIIQNKKLDIGTHQYELLGNDLKPGLYFCEFRVKGELLRVKKLWVQ